MDGFTVLSWSVPYTLSDLNWIIKDIGDFNGDRKADILWYHAGNGDVGIWFMDGPAIFSWGVPYHVPNLNWAIQDVSDMNGDGKSDVVWRETPTNHMAFWLMDSFHIQSISPLQP